MPAGGKNFQQAYNVQAGDDMETMLVVTAHVTQHANDKLEVEPTLKALQQLPETLGKVETLLGDTGYRSKSNTKLFLAANTTPYLAGGRESHHQAALQSHLRKGILSLPFPDRPFGPAVCVSVLKHFRALQTTVCELARNSSGPLGWYSVFQQRISSLRLCFGCSDIRMMLYIHPVIVTSSTPLEIS